MNDDYRFIAFIPPVGTGLRNDGVTWFDPSDPFQNRLAVLLGRNGDNWVGTVLYSGMPMLTVYAGPGYGDTEQYGFESAQYLEAERQEIQALFHERIIGDLPVEGDTAGWDEWPFPHAASVMVHEKRTSQYMRRYRQEELDRMPFSQAEAETFGLYDLYNDLMPESGSQGFGFIEFTGVVAWAMYRAQPDELQAPTGF